MHSYKNDVKNGILNLWLFITFYTVYLHHHFKIKMTTHLQKLNKHRLVFNNSKSFGKIIGKIF